MKEELFFEDCDEIGWSHFTINFFPMFSFWSVI